MLITICMCKSKFSYGQLDMQIVHSSFALLFFGINVLLTKSSSLVTFTGVNPKSTQPDCKGRRLGEGCLFKRLQTNSVCGAVSVKAVALTTYNATVG